MSAATQSAYEAEFIPAKESFFADGVPVPQAVVLGEERCQADSPSKGIVVVASTGTR